MVTVGFGKTPIAQVSCLARRWLRAEQLHEQRGQRLSRAAPLAAAGVMYLPSAGRTLPAAALCGSSSSAQPMGPSALRHAQAVPPQTGSRPALELAAPQNPRPGVASKAVQRGRPRLPYSAGDIAARPLVSSHQHLRMPGLVPRERYGGLHNALGVVRHATPRAQELPLPLLLRLLLPSPAGSVTH